MGKRTYQELQKRSRRSARDSLISKTEKGEHKMKVTLKRHEYKLVSDILNAPNDGQGASIKDLRLLDHTCEIVERAKGVPPVPPALRTLPPNEKHTQEEMQAHQRAMVAYQEAQKEFFEASVETDFSDASYNLIKSRLSSFGHYLSVQDVRKRVLAVADAFGIKE